MSEDTHETPPAQADANPPPKSEKPVPPHARDGREIPIRLLYEAETRTLPSGRTFTRNRCKVCRCYWDSHGEAFADQNEQERHGGLCPLNPGQPELPDCVKIAMDQYTYWRQFIDHEDEAVATNATGAMCAAANIVGGLIRKQSLPMEDKPVAALSMFTRRLEASNALLVSGGLQHMVNHLREGLVAKHFAAATTADWSDIERFATNSDWHGMQHPSAAAFAQSIELLDAFEAKLNDALLMLPAPTNP